MSSIISSLSPSQVALLSTTAISNLKTTDIAALSTAQAAALTAELARLVVDHAAAVTNRSTGRPSIAWPHTFLICTIL